MAYEAGDYRRALSAFERVFALRGVPDLLFNIYLCHRAMGDPEPAARALRRFLIARPAHPERARYEAVLAELDAQARALAERRTPPVAPPPVAPPPVAPPPPRAAPSSEPGAGPWIVLGTGVAAAGVGVALMLSANGDVRDAANASGERARLDLLDGASTQHTIGAALLGVGAAAALGGVLWRALAPSGSAARALSLGAGPGGVSVQFAARWP